MDATTSCSPEIGLAADEIAKVTVVPDVRELTLIENEIMFHESALEKLAAQLGFEMADINKPDAVLPEKFER